MITHKLWVALLSAVLTFAVPTFAWAHAFGEPVQLPMPYGLYIVGSVVALVLSFLLLAIGGRFFVKFKANAVLAVPALPSRWLEGYRSVLSLMLLAALCFSVATGFIGSNDSHRNFNMTFFWIVFALGGAYASMFVGDWYKHAHPWRYLLPARWKGWFNYPQWLGYWPALIQFMGLVSIELFIHSNPKKLALLLIGLAVVNVLGMALWGTCRWMQRGELFAVLFRLFAGCSPLRWVSKGDGKHRIRICLPFAELKRLRMSHPAQCLFVLFLLSSTAFDGLRETQIYFNVFWLDPFGWLEAFLGDHPLQLYPTVRPWFVALEVVLLILSPLFYLALFAVFLLLGKWVSGSQQSMGMMMRRYLPSLIPIAVVYHVTHYYTLLFSQGFKIRGLVSDPFGWGWNLFGTAITGRLPWLPDMASIWVSQVGLILLGHVAAVWLAHHEALRLERTVGRATLSQLPMLLLMVVFTSVGLWILAQPLKG